MLAFKAIASRRISFNRNIVYVRSTVIDWINLKHFQTDKSHASSKGSNPSADLQQSHVRSFVPRYIILEATIAYTTENI